MNGKQKITARAQWQPATLSSQRPNQNERTNEWASAHGTSKPRRKFLIYFAFHLVMDPVHMKYDVTWVCFFVALCCYFSFYHFYVCVCVFVFLHHGWCVRVFCISLILFLWVFESFSSFKKEEEAFFSFTWTSQHFTLTYLLWMRLWQQKKMKHFERPIEK